MTQIQSGIIRVNCMDCLDRTNNAMACIASTILGKMMKEVKIDIGEYESPKTGAVRDGFLSILFNIFGVSS